MENNVYIQRINLNPTEVHLITNKHYVKQNVNRQERRHNKTQFYSHLFTLEIE